MKYCYRLSAVFGLLLMLAVPAAAVSPPGGPQNRFTVPHIPAQLLVKNAPATTQQDIVDALTAFSAVVVEYSDTADLYVVNINADEDLPAALTLLATDPRFEYAQPNYLFQTQATPNDLNFSQQWSKDNTGVNAPGGLGTPGADMNLVAAWDTRNDASGVIVAVIDDSVETTHVDLAGNILPTGKCFASPGSQRPCTNGPDDPNPVDAEDFHGTLVSGTVAARGNNGLGIAGAAWVTGILPLKVDLSSFAIVNAIDEAIAQNADIINMSFGGPVQGAAQSEALGRAEAAGILAVAAAGNSDANNEIAATFPANADNPNVVSVAATNSQDKIASFSQWAPFSVDVAAPGEQVLSTAINNDYAVASGTSFAAPNIAGVAALIKAETGASDYRQLKAQIIHGGVNGVAALGPVIPGQDKRAAPGRVASGRIDADRALDGPAGGVLVIQRLTVNDSGSGNGNGVLEPGETALLEISIENIWTTEAAVIGSLSTTDPDLLTVNDTGPALFGTVVQDATATAAFSVTLSADLTGNEQVFMQLDLSSSANPVLPSRYFYLEAGSLTNGNTVAQAIQRWNWDEFHAFTVNVPVGATQLNISTAGPGDIDLLVRHNQSPRYLIGLRGSGFYYVDSDSQISSGGDANETVAIANPLPGAYHIVVVNFDQTPKTYEVTASYVPPSSGTVSFSSATYSAAEDAGDVVITATRIGGVGEATVDYQTSAGSATAQSDYNDVAGTLSWAVGENGPKTFSVTLLDDEISESTETVTLRLSNPLGTTLATPSTATLEISDDDNVGGVVAFTAGQYSVDEAAGTVQIGVTRHSGSLGAASVNVATAAGSATANVDYTETAVTITWADGETGTKTVAVPIVADSLTEPTETFTVQASDAQGAAIGSPSIATVAIADDDNTSSGSGSGGGGSTGLPLLLLLSCIALRRRR